jgi:hypothetical protein
LAKKNKIIPWGWKASKSIFGRDEIGEEVVADDNINGEEEEIEEVDVDEAK